MEADISQLEAPTFTTITRGPPEPMLRLKWDHKVSLIGEKVLNPMIHCCDQCEKPILIYGRMIPCKHIFCLRCARSEPIKSCPRCKEKVIRVEQSGLGTVFMCTHGGSRYGNTGCRRTYLSQRDLQAHINHRHVTASIESKSTDAKAPVVAQRKTVVVSDPSPVRQIGARPNQPFTSIVSPNLPNTPTTGRVNLVPIPIQELQQQSGQALSTGTPSSLLSALPHHQPPQTVATDLSAYFNQQQYGHGLTVSSYGSASQQSNSQQTQQFVPISLQQGQIMTGSGAISQQAGVHSMPPPVSSSSQFYAQYSQYNSMPTGQQNMHYSNARGNYEQASSNYQPNNAHGQSMQQQQQQQWQQNQYYR